METAHGLGIPTTATMMFGMGERLEHRIEHLRMLKEVQSRTGGFIAFIVLLAIRARRNGVVLRGIVAVAVVEVLLIVVPVVLTQVLIDAGAPAAGPSASSTPRTGSATAKQPLPAAQVPSATNVLNPNEQSSNAPRLDLYKAVLRAVEPHLLLGVGPGNLRAALAADHYSPPNQTTGQVVANDVWLQALADGGVPLVLLEAAFTVMVVVLALRRAAGPIQPVAAALVVVLVVSGLLTSYFFDIKVWVAFAIVLASATALSGDPVVHLASKEARHAR